MKYFKKLFKKLFAGPVDYEGQYRALRYMYNIINLFTIVGLIWGAVIKDFRQTVIIFAAGVLTAAIAIIPAWPIYKTSKLKWRKTKKKKKPGKRRGKHRKEVEDDIP